MPNGGEIGSAPPAGGAGAGGEGGGGSAPEEAQSQPAGNPARQFVELVLESSDKLLKALWVVAGGAAAKYGFDRLGKGDYDTGRWMLAVGSVVGFALGTVVVIGVGMSLVQGSRASHAWLLSCWGRSVRRRLEDTPYLLGGATNVEDLNTKLAGLMGLQYADPVDFLNSPLREQDREQLGILLEARDRLLDTAAAEKLQSLRYIAFIVGGALVAATSAGVFGFTTNQAVEAKERRVAERERQEVLDDRAAARVVTGELLPNTPSSVQLVIPGGESAKELSERLSLSPDDPCDPTTVKGTLLEVASPPSGNPAAVMHVFTSPSANCRSIDLWLPPAWLVPSTSDEDAPTTTTTTPKAAVTAATTTTAPKG